MKKQKYLKYIFMLLGGIVFLHENTSASEFFKSKIEYSNGKEHEVNLITFDGIFLEGKLYLEDKHKSKTFFTLFADNTSRDIYRKKLADKLSKTNAVFVAPTRKEAAARLMGANYQRWMRLSDDIRPKFNRTYYKGDRKWDFIEIKDVVEEVKKGGSFNKSVALIPSASAQIFIENYKNMPRFDAYVFLSAGSNVLELETEFFKEKKEILWVSSDFQTRLTEKLKEKFGGGIKIYKNAGVAYSMFFRNHEIYDDLFKKADK